MRIYNIVMLNTLSSIAYELMKLLHHIGLFYLMSTQEYATLGIIFSILYLTISISGFEFSSAIIGHISHITNSRSNFRQFVAHHQIPQLLLFAIAGSIATTVADHFFSIGNHISLGIMTLGIIFEGFRAANRPILHTMFYGEAVIKLELPIAITYFLVVWGYTWINQQPPLIHELVYLHIALSTLGALGFVFFYFHKYSRIKHEYGPDLKTPSNHFFYVPFFKSRAQLSILHFGKYLFSGNFLVPLFAHTISMEFAATFKLITTYLGAVGAIISSAIGLSANAIFRATQHARQKKDAAFKRLWGKTIRLITLMALAGGVAAMMFGQFKEMSSYNKVIILAFFLINVLDYLFVLYEHRFIMEKRITVLTSTRFIELLACIIILMLWADTPALGAIGVMTAKMISLTILNQQIKLPQENNAQ